MSDPAPPPRGFVEVARLGRSHGLEGAVRVHPLDDAARDALAAAPSVWVDGLGDARVVELKAHGAHLLLRLDRLRRVEAAKELVHAAVRVDPVELPEEVAAGLAPGAVGLPVRVDGREHGEVVAIEGPAASPILRVRGPGGERLLPLAADYVTLHADRVEVRDPPPGLLDDA